MKEVLIIEDDQALSEGLCLALKEPRLRITPCASLGAARRELQRKAFDLILLDINLPDGSGISLLKDIKKACSSPVILLTANDTEMDVVSGLESGADDYITKPFSLAILRARVNAQLRRVEEGSPRLVTLGRYIFDFERMVFSLDGSPVELSKTEQKLLRLLVENRGATLPRHTLLQRVWDDNPDYVDENTLSVAIKRLRDKLDAAEHIQTVYGLGYTWVAH